MEQESIIQGTTEGSALLGNRAITKHLRLLDYPESSLRSMEKCGELTGLKMVQQCACTVKVFDLVHHCNHRTCSPCAKRRERRLGRQYLRSEERRVGKECRSRWWR